MDLLSLFALVSAIIISFITSGLFFYLHVRSLDLPTDESKVESQKEPEQSPATQVDLPQTSPSLTFNDRLNKGLGTARNSVWSRVTQMLQTAVDSLTGQGFSSELRDELEEILYSADLSTNMVEELMEKMQEFRPDKNDPSGADPATQARTWIRQYFYEKIHKIQSRAQPLQRSENNETQLVMIVGVNGAGKTTTIGKVSTQLRQQGHSVVVGACDTFRAAAVDQLQVWCERSGANMVRGKEGADPSGVAYESFLQAVQKQSDFCIIDTAGRLHTKGDLMEELAKTKRVLTKLRPEGPHHTLLVLDAITGQNALRQAEEFHKTLGLTGLIFTKCDGSSKAGSALSIIDKLKIPVVYIGVGEGVDDLDVFHLEDYLSALIPN